MRVQVKEMDLDRGKAISSIIKAENTKEDV